MALAAAAVLSGCSSGPRPLGGTGAAADVRKGDVLGRPWPERMTPTGPWAASMDGTGPRLTLTIAGTVVGGLGRTTVEMAEDRALLLPTGERWYPKAPFRVEGEGDVAFALTGGGADSGGATSLAAAGSAVRVQVHLGRLVEAGGGQVRVRGEFVRSDGERAEELVVPTGTAVVPACDDPATTTTTSPFPPSCERGPEGSEDLVAATVEAAEGTVVRASGDGEAAVAGKARAEAGGRSWDGLVVAVEGAQVDAEATYDGGAWSVSASAADARQVWVDVWPVVDTVLQARSYSTDPGFFDRSRLLFVEWTNVGHATAQILGATGAGPGAPGVGFSLNETLGHDAGLGIGRGDTVVNFGGGGDIDSNLPPGTRVRRELSYAAGQPATVVLQGNFPDVGVELDVPGG